MVESSKECGQGTGSLLPEVKSEAARTLTVARTLTAAEKGLGGSVSRSLIEASNPDGLMHWWKAEGRRIGRLMAVRMLTVARTLTAAEKELCFAKPRARAVVSTLQSK
ncbi:unnamed protein product [Linum trigynum]|uniref:Uncharacterized protein n=1 Tax=Linum trigynum TaxID=586398 RepID=A0AAV2F3S2_9ROSI